MSATTTSKYRERHVTNWRSTDHPIYQMVAEVDGDRWEIAIGDFPAEDLYHLVVQDQEVETFNEWPAIWNKPSPPSRPERG